MERRTALKNLAFAVAGVFFVPSCNLWESGQSPEGFLNNKQKGLLNNIAGTLIPDEESLPGALALKVPEYVKIMLADCKSQEMRDLFFLGLATLESRTESLFRKPFSEVTRVQKEEMLAAMENSATQADRLFYALVKGLVVQGYLSSEYVQLNFRNFKMIPGPVYGCINTSTT